jgi:hypothetical protein
MNILFALLLAFTFLQPSTTVDGGKKSKKTATVTIEGTYESVRGVMKPLSCYCFDAGYVTTANGDEIAVCFEKNELEEASKASEKWSCDRIKVTGTYVEKTISSSPDSPCPAGTKRYLKVSKFECQD